jgi:hypothetical protein
VPSTFEKLNLKNQRQIVVLNAPRSFEPELTSLRETKILSDFRSLEEIEFLLAFVTRQSEVEVLARDIAGKVKGDAVVWFAYPKKTSKNYKSEITRDNGFRILGQIGFEGVRAVAIDEDWSAIRFRRVEFIKVMSRGPKGAMTAQGKARVRRK